MALNTTCRCFGRFIAKVAHTHTYTHTGTEHTERLAIEFYLQTTRIQLHLMQAQTQVQNHRNTHAEPWAPAKVCNTFCVGPATGNKDSPKRSLLPPPRSLLCCFLLLPFCCAIVCVCLRHMCVSVCFEFWSWIGSTLFVLAMRERYSSILMAEHHCKLLSLARQRATTTATTMEKTLATT